VSALGYPISKEDYLKRLRRIEGQVRGLQRRMDDDTGDEKIVEAIARLLRS
jgi:DNA-binding FrmR family transcriptional regulator